MDTDSMDTDTEDTDTLPFDPDPFDPDLLIAEGWTRTTQDGLRGGTDKWTRGEQCFITPHIPLRCEYPQTREEYLQPPLVDLESQNTEWRVFVCVVGASPWSEDGWHTAASREIHDLFLTPEGTARRAAQAAQSARGLAEGETYLCMDDSHWTTFCEVYTESCSEWLEYRKHFEIDTHAPYAGAWCKDPRVVVFEVIVRGTANAQRVLDWFKGVDGDVVYAEATGGWANGNPHK